jgi:squalene synthase HpnC
VTVAAQPHPVGVHDLPGEDTVVALAAHENFSVASVLLGRRARGHLRAIYGYARLVDQVGDEIPGDRRELLDAVEVDLERAFAGRAEHPLLRRLSVSIAELDLPREPFQRLLEANRRDQATSRYRTFSELLEYCDLSANPVGELVLYVFGVATPQRIALSDRVCTALQLAEHWQDVAEDHRRGRVYLPAEDLDRFGVTDSDLGAERATHALRSLMEFEVERARSLLDEGAELTRLLRGRARVAVAGYVGGGRAALDAIAAAGYDVLAATPRAGRARRARRTLGALA